MLLRILPSAAASQVQRPSAAQLAHSLVVTSLLLVPIIFALLSRRHSTILEPFTPRAAIHDDDSILRLILLAPWSVPRNSGAGISRGIQCVALGLLSKPESIFGSFVLLYTYWIGLAMVRILVGYLLSRSVGWAIPRMFSHEALYEPCGGLGPSMIADLFVQMIREPQHPLYDRSAAEWIGRLRLRMAIGMPAITAALCWLESAPWTYGISLVMTATVVLVLHLLRRSNTDGWSQNDAAATSVPLRLPRAHHRDSDCESAATDAEQSPISTNTPATHHGDSLKAVIIPAILSFAAILLPYLVQQYTVRPHRVPLPRSALDGDESVQMSTPLVEILILSFPRPVDLQAATSILSTTITSFLPFLSPLVTLSVYTHTPLDLHPAFTQIRDSLDNESIRGAVRFHADEGSHPDQQNGHYLHLAESFAWMHVSSAAEWIMLVEDDFPLCHGTKGWEVVENVLAMLEARRLNSDIGAGFVGTGGSGLIIHRSRLLLLSALLHLHTTLPPIIPPDMTHPAPDQLIQSCLLGHRHSPCERSDTNRGRLIITNRLVLDHIGGMATTTAGKAGNSDKWRCGWRHAFHGMPEVDVVIV